MPRLGLVRYHNSTSLTSDCSSTLHSAQPVSSLLPSSVAFLRLVKTVPLDIGVGGVPIKIVCGFGLAAIVYFKADSWSSVYSWASSITSKSKLSPSPPVEVLVLKSILPPSFITILSLPIAFIFV